MEGYLPTMSVDASVLSGVEKALRTEWLLTNGLGGYASSTVLGMNTRKYHGLLVAALNPPVDRHLILAKVDEEIRLSEQQLSLGATDSASGLQPRNAVFPDDFSLCPLPTYTYQIDESFRLKKTVFMPHEKNASVIIYEAKNNAEEEMRIFVSPLVNFRNFHMVTRKGQVQWNISRKNSNQLLIMQPSTGFPTLALFTTDGSFVAGQGEWVETYYRAESERGESSVDYNFKPGFFEFSLAPKETRSFSIIAAASRDERKAEDILSTIFKRSTDIEALYDSELKRRMNLLDSFQKQHSDIHLEDWLAWLVLAADSFIVSRQSTNAKSVIAGYHWFADWGRDSLISLPGLTLVLGRFEDAKKILQTFNQCCYEGLIPNSFSDDSQQTPAYNTVDATLWFFHAVLQYLKYTGDFQFVQKAFWSTMQSIINHHKRGTLFDIRVDADGLLTHGAQLTWMDAAPDGRPVTPRDGKAVEIQALWYNALRIMELLAGRFDQSDRAEQYREMAQKTQESFVEKFWNPKKNYLFDVISDAGRNDSLRPNQVLAISLDFTMLDKVKAELVVESVWKQLLTPFGLRTLSSSDQGYVGKYRGDRWQRDTAYHNGSVWAWLLGSFTTSFLKLRNYEAHWRSVAFENFLKPLFTVELYRAGLGSISEIFDGDSPHESKGCIAQAWSVAEPLRAYVEEVLMKRPPYERKVLEPI